MQPRYSCLGKHSTNGVHLYFLTLYVRSILLSSESKGSSGGSSHEEHATKKALGTVTDEGENSTEGFALIKAIRPANAWSFSWDCLVSRNALCVLKVVS